MTQRLNELCSLISNWKHAPKSLMLCRKPDKWLILLNPTSHITAAEWQNKKDSQDGFVMAHPSCSSQTMKAGNKATVTSLLSPASSLPVPVSASHRAGTSWIQISSPSFRYRQEILSGDEGVWPGQPGRSQCDQFVIKLKLHTYWKCWCIHSMESSPGTRYLEEKSVSVVTYIKKTTTALKWTTLHIMLETSLLPCSRPITPPVPMTLPNSSSLPLH